MTPEERFTNLVEQVDDVTDAALDGATKDLEDEMLRVLFELFELERRAETELAAGRRLRLPQEDQRRLDMLSERMYRDYGF